MNKPEEQTTMLLKAWYEGDEQAVGSLLEFHLPKIQEMVRKRLGHFLRQKEESGDLVQEAIVKFLRYGPRIELANGKVFRSFFVRIVENVLRDKIDFYTTYRRSVERERRLDSRYALNLETPSEVVDKNQQHEWVRLAVEFVDETDRQIIALREWEGLSYPEIGKKVGLATGTARMRHDRAMMRLAAVLAKIRRGKVASLLTE